MHLVQAGEISSEPLSDRVHVDVLCQILGKVPFSTSANGCYSDTSSLCKEKDNISDHTSYLTLNSGPV